MNENILGLTSNRKLWLTYLLVGFLLLCLIILFIYFFALQWLSSHSITYLLVTLLGFVVFIPILYRLANHSFDLAEPGIWFSFFFFVHFGIRAIWDLVFGSPFLNMNPGADDLGLVNAALGMSILALLCFWLGYHRQIGSAFARSLPPLPLKWNIKLVLPIALFCSGVGWGIRLFLILSQSEDVLAWILSSKDIFLRMSKGMSYLKNISSLATISVFLVLIAGRAMVKQKYKLLSLILLIPELIFAFLTGKRSAMPFLILSFFIAYYMTSERGYKKNIKLIWGIAIIFLLLIILFPIISAVRFGGVSNINVGLTSSLSPISLFNKVGNRLHALDSLALIMDKVPNQIPYSLGSEIGLLTVAWIPRKTWLDKPIISIGKIFREKMVPPGLFPEGAAVSVSLPGQFYWDFSIPGVIIGMFLVGIFWRFLHEYLVRPRGNLSNCLIVGFMFTSFFVPLEQTVVTALSGSLFKLLLIIIIIFILSVSKSGIRSGIVEE